MFVVLQHFRNVRRMLRSASASTAEAINSSVIEELEASLLCHFRSGRPGSSTTSSSSSAAKDIVTDAHPQAMVVLRLQTLGNSALARQTWLSRRSSESSIPNVH